MRYIQGKANGREMDELKDYLTDKGFMSGGIWYFRGTWMGKGLLNNLQRSGLVRRIGTSVDLRKVGVKSMPDRIEYNGRIAGSIFYQVTSLEINSAANLH